MNLFSATISKSGKYVNLAIVDGEGDDRKFIHVPVLIGQANRQAVIETDPKTGGRTAVIRVSVIKTKAEIAQEKQEEANAPAPDVNGDDLPF